HKLITTQNGYLIIKSRTVSVRGSQAGVRTNGSLKQRTSYCLDEGFLEVSVVSSSSTEDTPIVWAGSWTAGDDVPTQGASLSESVLLQLRLDSGPEETMAIDFVRYYQRVGSSSRSCDETTLQTLDFARSYL
ncbi:hypothetical protein E4T56_gene2304, partial [Termitomyces sp. T112]